MTKRAIICLCAAALFGGIYIVGDTWASWHHTHQQNIELTKKVQELQAEKEGLQLRLDSFMQYAKDVPSMGVSRVQMRRVIGSTLRHLSVPQAACADWERLLLLTIAAESDGGRLLKQIGGPARGVVQCEPATEKEVLAWARSRKPELYSKIKALRVPAHLSVHELEYNTAYAVAVAYALYSWRRVNPVGMSITNLARAYKKHYNTPAGKATVQTALLKAGLWGVD